MGRPTDGTSQDTVTRGNDMMLTYSHMTESDQGTPEKIGVERAQRVVFDVQEEEELEDDLFFDDEEDDNDQDFLDDNDEDDDLYNDDNDDEDFLLELGDDEEKGDSF